MSVPPSPPGFFTRLRTGASTGARRDPDARSRALVILDLQRDFLAPDGRLPVEPAQAAPLLAATSRALATARAAGIAVISIENAFPRSAWFANLARRHAAIVNAPGAERDPRVAWGDAPRFTKAARDGFRNPALDAHLREAGIGELAIGGVMTEACVRGTVVGALARGYAVTVLADAVASATARRRDAALADLASLGARVLDTEQWAAEIRAQVPSRAEAS